MLSALDSRNFWSLVHMLCGRGMGTQAILINCFSVCFIILFFKLDVIVFLSILCVEI